MIRAIFLLFFSVQPLYAKDTLLIHLANFPPLGVIEEGKASGYFPDLFKEVLSQSELKTDFKIVPIARYNQLFGEGKIEIGFWPWGFKSENHTNLGYAGDVNFGIFSFKDKNLDPISDKIACKANKTPIFPPSERVITNHSFSGCIRMLEANRVDYAFVLKPLIVDLMKTNPKYTYQPSGSLRLHLFVHNKHRKHFASIKKNLKGIDLKSFNKKYYVDYLP